MSKSTAFILILFAFASVSCKKHNNPATACSTTLYGYLGAFDATGAFSPQTFGVINPATVTSSSIATFMSSNYSNQGAYDPAGNYYVLKYYNTGTTQVLYKVNVGTGAVATITGTLNDYEGLVYNRFNNKLYCVTTTPPAKVAELSISGSTYSEINTVNTVTAGTAVSPVSSTVDNATGTIYYSLLDLSGSLPSVSIEKYTPGSSPAVVLTAADTRFLGIRFNKNDNTLYAVRENSISSSSSSFDFVKINPATGAVTSIAALSFTVNNEFYSATIDPCANRYILTVINDFTTSAGTCYQLKISDGSVVQTNATTPLYQGLEEYN